MHIEHFGVCKDLNLVVVVVVEYLTNVMLFRVCKSVHHHTLK